MNPSTQLQQNLGSIKYSEKAGLIHSRTADHMFHYLENESAKTLTSLLISNKQSCSKNPELTDEWENSPSIDTHESRELRMYRVSQVDSLSGHTVFKEFVDGVLCSGYQITSKVTSQEQRHGRTQNKLPSDSVVPGKGITACITSDIKGTEITPKISLKRQVTRERTTTKASNQMSVQKESINVSVPKASMKGRVKQKRTTVKASNMIVKPKENIGISVTSDRTCVAIVHQSPLTRNKAKSLSVSTPESMKRSRSGRLIVPRLDPGSQNIIYGPDGIVGITNLEVHFSQECNSEPPSKRRKRSGRLSADNRLLTF